MARRSSKRKKSNSLWGSLLMMLLGAGVALAAVAWWMISAPYGPVQETFVELAPGSSTARIGTALEQAGIIRSRYAFDLLRLYEHGRLQAGEYRFAHPATVSEVYRRIAHGDVVTRPLTVPEGANIYDIAARVEQAQLASRADFLAAAHQTELIADLDPQAQSLEGYLFPDTYRFAHNATAPQMAAAMVHRFRQAAEQAGILENYHATVTLASIVERETAVAAERPLVASVFTNRLAKGMPLATDPSVIYGLLQKGRWAGIIHRSDLEGDTPYNTYLHAGLPPGPISNPGLPSLKAAAHPAATNYLYFVAAGTDAQGHSRFAATLDEHNHNVAGYRRAQRKAGLR
jgi:UPF0755 protein